MSDYKYFVPSENFAYFGYSCINTTTCENLLINHYKEVHGVSDTKGIDLTQRVQCYINDAPDGNLHHEMAESDRFSFYKTLNETFCACRIDYGWQGEFCDKPSYRSRGAAALYFVIFFLMLIVVFMRFPLSRYSFKSNYLRISNPRGFTLKSAIMAHSILFPLASIGAALYFLIGPTTSKTSYIILVVYAISYLLGITLTLLSLLTLTIAFIDIATSMKQLQGFKKARLPLVVLIIAYFIFQILFLLVRVGNESLYVTVAMFVILLVLVVVGPGWMFFKFSVSLLQEQSSDRERRHSTLQRTIADPVTDTIFTGFYNCFRALSRDIGDSICNRNNDLSYDDGDDEGGDSNAHQDSKESKDGVVTEIISNSVTPNHGSETDKAHSRDRSLSKEVAVPRDISLSEASGVSMSRITNSAVNPKDSKRLTKPRTAPKQKSDKMVARFLSRVLQLSIRVGIAIVLFVIPVVAVLTSRDKYFSLSLNMGDVSLQALATFLQIIFAFMITDTILWFFSDVLRKEMARANNTKVQTNLRRTVPKKEENEKQDVKGT